mgnify:CR=1 FL=1
MVAKIVSSIPESLRDKVVVAPHPLFDQATFAGSPGKAAVGSYDELLRGVRLLITDYSTSPSMHSTGVRTSSSGGRRRTNVWPGTARARI